MIIDVLGPKVVAYHVLSAISGVELVRSGNCLADAGVGPRTWRKSIVRT